MYSVKSRLDGSLWHRHLVEIPGAGTFCISLSDAIYETETLIDDIKFESTATAEEVCR